MGDGERPHAAVGVTRHHMPAPQRTIISTPKIAMFSGLWRGPHRFAATVLAFRGGRLLRPRDRSRRVVLGCAFQRAAADGGGAGRNPRKAGELRRTATRSCICIQRAVARTRKSPLSRWASTVPPSAAARWKAITQAGKRRPESRARLRRSKPHAGKHKKEARPFRSRVPFRSRHRGGDRPSADPPPFGSRSAETATTSAKSASLRRLHYPILPPHPIAPQKNIWYNTLQPPAETLLRRRKAGRKSGLSIF